MQYNKNDCENMQGYGRDKSSTISLVGYNYFMNTKLFYTFFRYDRLPKLNYKLQKNLDLLMR